MAQRNGVDPRLSLAGQKDFEEFKAQRAEDQMYNKEEEYYKLNPDKRNLISGAHSTLSRAMAKYIRPYPFVYMQP